MYLAEWKLYRESLSDRSGTVLIVPCGMETLNSYFYIKSLGVLIVPCGMETIKKCGYCNRSIGINCTLRNGNWRSRTRKPLGQRVLIVPCGMETTDLQVARLCPLRINCTLRNGNVVSLEEICTAMGSINCTLRNGNSVQRPSRPMC